MSNAGVKMILMSCYFSITCRPPMGQKIFRRSRSLENTIYFPILSPLAMHRIFLLDDKGESQR